MEQTISVFNNPPQSVSIFPSDMPINASCDVVITKEATLRFGRAEMRDLLVLSTLKIENYQLRARDVYVIGTVEAKCAKINARKWITGYDPKLDGELIQKFGLSQDLIQLLHKNHEEKLKAPEKS